MTWREWMAARQLLFEEHLGIHIRAQNTAQLVADQRKADEYARSVARLKAQQRQG